MTEPRDPAAPSPQFRLPGTDGPVGIGGWLLLFTVGQAVSILLNGLGALDLSGFSEASWSLGTRVPMYRPFLVIEEASQALMALAGVVGMVLLLRRDHRAPRFYFGLLAFIVLYGVVETIGMARLYPQLIALVQEAGGSTAGMIEEQRTQQTTGLREVAYGLAWILYWRTSKRVAHTFRAPQPTPAVTSS